MFGESVEICLRVGIATSKLGQAKFPIDELDRERPIRRADPLEVVRGASDLSPAPTPGEFLDNTLRIPKRLVPGAFALANGLEEGVSGRIEGFRRCGHHGLASILCRAFSMTRRTVRSPRPVRSAISVKVK